MSELWYALHARSRFEKFVQKQLKEKGYEVFLPRRLLRPRWSDRVKTSVPAPVPNYVFCRFDSHARLPILLIPGPIMSLAYERCLWSRTKPNYLPFVAARHR